MIIWSFLSLGHIHIPKEIGHPKKSHWTDNISKLGDWKPPGDRLTSNTDERVCGLELSTRRLYVYLYWTDSSLLMQNLLTKSVAVSNNVAMCDTANKAVLNN